MKRSKPISNFMDAEGPFDGNIWSSHRRIWHDHWSKFCFRNIRFHPRHAHASNCGNSVSSAGWQCNNFPRPHPQSWVDSDQSLAWAQQGQWSNLWIFPPVFIIYCCLFQKAGKAVGSKGSMMQTIKVKSGAVSIRIEKDPMDVQGVSLRKLTIEGNVGSVRR